MTKNRKRVLIATAVTLGVVLVAAGVAVVYVDSLAAAAVRSGTSRALGVATTVDDVDVGLISGQVTVSGLTIANPEGFDSAHFLQLDRVRTSVEVGSLLADVVRVPELAIEGLEMRLDQRATSSNYGVILDHLAAYGEADPQPADAPPAGSDGGTQLAIDRLTIEASRVVVNVSLPAGIAEEVVVPLERIQLDDLSTAEDGGVGIGQLAGIVVEVVAATALANAGDRLPDEVEAGLRAALEPVDTLKALGLEAAGAAQGAALDALRKALGGDDR